MNSGFLLSQLFHILEDQPYLASNILQLRVFMKIIRDKKKEKSFDLQ